MAEKSFKRYFVLLVFLFLSLISFGQSVPLGIFYQAVARDNFGKELASKEIDVKFSIISGNPLGTVVYQELHSKVVTSKYGVFSLIIGHGIPTGGIYGELSQIKWSQAYHYLKIEVKFENDFIDMGTMQFLAVPYALYAQKSLEPGPQGVKGDTGPQGLQGIQGQKGDPGNPASDDQTLSFNGNNLSISGGNTVNLSNLNIPHQLSIFGDTLSIMGGNKVRLTNQIQDLQLDVNNKLKISKNASATEIDLTRFLDDKQQLSFNSADSTLSITNGTTSVDLSIFNQSLSFNNTNNKLSLSGSLRQVDLGVFKQNLTYNNTTGILSISNGTGADLSLLKTDEIQDIHLTGNQLTIDKNSTSTGVDLSKYLDDKDNQTLSYNSTTNTLSLTNGGSVNLTNLIAFRAIKTTSVSASTLTEVPFVPETIPGTDEYNDGNAFIRGTGEFIAPITGIYTFSISYYADGSGGARKLIMFYNGTPYEEVAVEIAAGTLTSRSITMKLNAADTVRLKINTGTSTQTGTGSFSGYRVH
jgi:hypothetical protein